MPYRPLIVISAVVLAALAVTVLAFDSTDSAAVAGRVVPPITSVPQIPPAALAPSYVAPSYSEEAGSGDTSWSWHYTDVPFPVRPLTDPPPDGQHYAPASVIGADERIQITNTTAFPFRAIAYLEIYDGLTFIATCSATFVGPDVLFTAAHCLHSGAGYYTAIAVVPGKNGVSEPFGFEFAFVWGVPNGWVNSGGTDPNFDWGILVMADSDLGNTVGWLRAANMTTSTLSRPDFTPAIVGYPGDKPQGTMWGAAKDAFTQVQSQALTYTIDTYAGQSGSAIFSLNLDEVFLGYVVGVHTQGGATSNSGTRFTAAMLSSIISFCTQLGCTIDSYTEPAATPTPTATPTPSPTPTHTPSPTPTATLVTTPTPTQVATASPTATSTASSTPTVILSNISWYQMLSKPGEASQCDLTKPVPPNSPADTGLCISLNLAAAGRLSPQGVTLANEVRWVLNREGRLVTDHVDALPIGPGTWHKAFSPPIRPGHYTLDIYLDGVLAGHSEVQATGDPSTPAGASNFEWYKGTVGTSAACDMSKPIESNASFTRLCLTYDLMIATGTYDSRFVVRRNGALLHDLMFETYLFTAQGWAFWFQANGVPGDYELLIYADGELIGEATTSVTGPPPSPTSPGQSATPSPSVTATPAPPAPPSPSPTVLGASATPAPTPTPTPTPVEDSGLLGDTDCDLDVDAVDALHDLQDIAGFEPDADCLEQGDVQCDGDRDAVDALGILTFVAGLQPQPQQPGCPVIGSQI